MQYLQRIADKQLANKLAYAGAVCIRGPKWCGKTSTAAHQAKSAVYLQDPDTRNSNVLLAKTKPSVLLRGERPRLIDEWQDTPELWDAARYSIDREQLTGAYIFTGSVVPGKNPLHTGTGRFSFLDMRPMSLAESLESTGEVSLTRLFQHDYEVEGASETDIEVMAFLICRGGWPRAVTIGGNPSLNIAQDYVSMLCEEDVVRTGVSTKNPSLARSILSEYSRCTASSASLNSMRANLAKRGSENSKEIVNAYISVMHQLYALEDLESWSPSLHAKSRIVRKPARFPVDPSIAAAALGASPERLMQDLSTLGLLFEALCIRDLRVYAEAAGGRVMRYRDNTGLEADAVVELRDGRYGLIEVKLGAAFVDTGAESLLKLAGKLDTSIMGSPSFLAVITPGGHAFQRADGVFVIPISCLKD